MSQARRGLRARANTRNLRTARSCPCPSGRAWTSRGPRSRWRPRRTPCGRSRPARTPVGTRAQRERSKRVRTPTHGRHRARTLSTCVCSLRTCRRGERRGARVSPPRARGGTRANRTKLTATAAAGPAARRAASRTRRTSTQHHPRARGGGRARGRRPPPARRARGALQRARTDDMVGGRSGGFQFAFYHCRTQWSRDARRHFRKTAAAAAPERLTGAGGAA